MSRAYALSIKQPWASLLVAGLKTIEVRSWPTRIRGRVLIHAARIADGRADAWQWVPDGLRPLTELGGGIIGEAELIDCVRYATAGAFAADCERHRNEPDWFQDRGLYGFVFRNAAPLPFRKCPGNVRFFRVEDVG
jgi:hypothetical protein